MESTVLTHGLPYPQNLEILHKIENQIRESGACPATIIVLDGTIHIGLGEDELGKLESYLKTRYPFQKIAQRELFLAIAKKQSGGTTVSATMYLAHQIGIRIFATGGIGGVHRDWNRVLDVSADLMALSSIPVIVVSAGCKAILDIAATLEALESLSVPVYGWKTDVFPAFYSRNSGHSITRIDDALDLVTAYTAMLDLGAIGQRRASGMLLANPIPPEDEIPIGKIEPLIQQALFQAREEGVQGKKLTPFLLDFLAHHSQGESIRANLSLLMNNACVAAEIARELSGRKR